MFEGRDVTVALAAAGSGKTTYLINVFMKELNGGDGSDIAFVSFTRNAVREIIERIQQKMIPDVSTTQLDYFRTVHSLATRALGLTQKNFITKKDIENFNKITGFTSIGLDYATSGTPNNDEYKNADTILLEKAMHEKLTGEIPFDVVDVERYKLIKELWEKYKKELNKYEYNDILFEYLKRGEPLNDVRVALLDEFQDCSELQVRVLDKMFTNCKKIYIAGDDKQAIFTFIGSRPDILVEMAKDPDIKKVNLSTSHRISRKICRLSEYLVNALHETAIKECTTDSTVEGNVMLLDDWNIIASKIAEGKESWYCLFRCNSYITQFEELLKARMVLYFRGNEFCVHKETLKLLQEYKKYRDFGYGTLEDRKAFMEKYAIPDFSVSPFDTLLIKDEKERLFTRAYVDKYGLQTLVEASIMQRHVILSTIHGAKGSEADNVALFLESTKKVDDTVMRENQSEMRLLYVACTRAKKDLFIVRSKKNSKLNDLMEVIVSEYEYGEALRQRS